MLTLLRGLLRSKLGFIVFGLVILAMAGWGVTDVFGGGLGDRLVSAGQRSITDQQFDSVVERQLRNATDDRGRAISKEQALEEGLIDQIFSRQQFDVLLRAYADKVGATASEDQIKETITSIPAFRDTTDVFDPALLQAYLRQEGFSQKTFEDQLESDLTISRLQQLPRAGLQAPKVLARGEAAFNGELRAASWFILPKSALPELDPPTDDDLQTLYTERQASLRIPERRKVSLIQLSVDDFLSRAVVAEEDIVAFYEAYQRERYTGPDTRTFKQFRFTDEAAARASLGLIAGGAAAEVIDALDSSNVVTGKADSITNQRLSQQVFAASSQPGSLHGPVEVDGLWTVIRLEEIEPGDVTPFEIVREEIENELARDQAIGFFYEALPQFDDLIGTGANLEEIAEDLGTPLMSFAAIDQRGVSETGAFYRPILEAEGLLADLFNRPEGATTQRVGTDEVTYIARVDEIVPERMPPIEEVKDRLGAAWTQQKDFEQLQTVAGEVEARINSGDTTLTEEAARFDAIVQALPRPVTRTAQRADIPPQLLTGIFNARAEGDVITIPSQADMILVLQVTQIDRPGPEAIEFLAESNVSVLQQQLNEDLFQAFFTDIQEDIEVKINSSGYAAYKARITPVQ